ncbi:hypothetical protein GDO78_022221 [Eleutherodactylus coqui]|uniref:Insulin-induced gene protein n=1 Tax=Eleutherodactylus coqui TaxID=57060 RepID=A0A8J6EM80_ELECQ|nr:hypothetical protein GDO78_022221 [Eleutherodactylus coqui]
MGDRQDVRGPSHRMTLQLRGFLLFLIGVFLALVLNLLQVQRNVTLFPPDVLSSLLSSAWWVPLCCGTAAAAIGLLYPYIDRHLGEPHKFKREWSSVMRCVAVFVGINHASAVSFLMCLTTTRGRHHSDRSLGPLKCYTSLQTYVVSVFTALPAFCL